jgi:integrase
MQERAGRFFLKARGKRGIYYICWYERRQTKGVSTRTANLDEARQALYQHHLTAANGPKGLKDAQLADILNRYALTRCEEIRSSEVFMIAMRNALDIWGDPDVSELTAGKQLEFVADLRGKGLADSTILRRLNALWAAINRAHEDGMIVAAPPRLSNNRWQPHLPNREQTLTLAELASLFNACGQDDAGKRKNRDTRYSREHWWRYLILAVGTGARPEAILELDHRQADFSTHTLALNPPGRVQTKKRRPRIPMAPTLEGWIMQWGEGHLITYYDAPLDTLEFFDTLREAVKTTATAYTIRHTVATWLASQGVPAWERDSFLGHASAGSKTGERYAHADPQHMARAREAIEDLFVQLEPLVKRPLRRVSALQARGRFGGA